MGPQQRTKACYTARAKSTSRHTSSNPNRQAPKFHNLLPSPPPQQCALPCANQFHKCTFRSLSLFRTVNCDKCTFTQSVPGNAQMYICCMCNEIIECFPLYGVFTCGICMAKVIYPYGTSSLIKCTKCLTVNRVNP